MKRGLWLLLGAAGVAVGVAAERYSIRAHAPDNHWLDLAVGWTYMAAGLVALARRPLNRVGLLMTAFGFAWFIGNFGTTRSPLLVSLGTAYQSVSAAVLAHLVLAYPTGRIERRDERTVVALLYAWILAQGTALALTFDPPSLYGCLSCPSGALAAFPSRAGYDDISNAGNVVGAIFAITIIGLLIRRFLGSSRVARRDLAPLWLGAMLVGVAFILEGVRGTLLNSADQSLVTAQKVAELLVPLAFLAGLARSRLAESSVARLVVELDRPLRHGELRDLLARAIGDPSLRLAFATPGGRGFVDENGAAVTLPQNDAGLTTTLVPNDGTPIAALIHDRLLGERQPVVAAVGAAARLALENERLHAEVRAQLEEVRASRTRIVEAADAERRRVERDLHDGAQQRLVTLSLELGLARERASAGRDADLCSSLAAASEEVAAALAELRELGRGLHPSILTEAGLGPALESLAERSTTPATVACTLARRLPAPVEIGAYFVASEALANAAKHAIASRVDLTAQCVDGFLVLEISDDGIGGADANCGSGLAGLADRVAALDGRLEITSPTGSGTRIVAEIPCG